MELSINQIQQLDYLLKLMPIFCRSAINKDFPKYQLIIRSEGDEYIGDFIEFDSDDGTLLRSIELGKTAYRTIAWESTQSLREIRISLQKRTGINDREYNDRFPYNRLAENPDILLGFLIKIINDVDIDTDASLPMVVMKNAYLNNNNYSCLLFSESKCTLIGLTEAKTD